MNQLKFQVRQLTDNQLCQVNMLLVLQNVSMHCKLQFSWAQVELGFGILKIQSKMLIYRRLAILQKFTCKGFSCITLIFCNKMIYCVTSIITMLCFLDKLKESTTYYYQ
ncbi:Hypothetical_protein [Hexamita inflata]|uniref:Hypothetical_protein n=1 Tax=Hexamita inflata TaxID=28002 RepID=A0AA86U9R3_9EUKA|nr:Hypothetical protein HINF_LOCUS36720 [Hexamita inflata]